MDGWEKMDYKKLIKQLRDPELRYMATRQYYMQDAATAIETLLADRETAGWISVKDRLPKFGLKCLITDGDRVMRGYLRRDGIWKYGIEEDEVWSKCSSWPVTHWMPLPTPP